ncbi:MAG: 7-carboxy-7-deazaguanine synthase QueE [Rickettsiales bacterium]
MFPTFQGEGPHIGMPAVFVRLGGCNLACRFCDAEFDDFTLISVGEILKTVDFMSRNEDGKRLKNLVVVTGGEPFRQPIGPLCETLLGSGFSVAIESNGTLYRPIPKGVGVVCSPKNAGGGYAPVREDVLKRAIAIKFIVSATMEGYGDVAEIGQTRFNVPVFLQPMDELDESKNAANYRRTLNLAEKYGYRLSLQLHKFYRID